MTRAGQPAHKTPTWRIPGIIMKLKNNETLAYVANHCGKPAGTVAVAIIDGLKKAGFLVDDPVNYDCMLSEAIQGDATVAAVSEIFKKALGVTVLSCTMWDFICGCVVIGDGDCPECGGEMQLYDYRGHETGHPDPYTEPEYTTDWEQWRCPICGHIIEKDFTN